VAIDLEEPAQILARVGAPETIGAQDAVALAKILHKWADLVA